MTTTRRLTQTALLAAYVATIPAANLAVEHFGVVPVGLDLHGSVLLAPAGVYAVGVALVLRDLAREAAGRVAVVAAIAVGAALSYLLATPALAVASTVAFAASESLDFAVYEPLRKRGLIRCVLAGLKRLGWERAHDWLAKRAPEPQQLYIAAPVAVSNTVGLIADSLIFLGLAFGSLQYLPGQMFGKAWMTLGALVIIAAWRGRAARAQAVAA